MQTESYDVVIVGAGQAGPSLAQAFAQAGRRTAIVEREHVGGTCINEGCTPTKTMVASARVAYLARRAADYGVQTGPISVDMAAVRQRKRAIVDSWRAGGTQRLEQADNLDLLMGTARFSAPHTLHITLNAGGEQQLTAPTIILNAGAHPSTPALAGIEQVAYLNSTSIMELDTVPEHLLVIGGGYIGLEFAQMFRRFGSQVTVIQRSDQLLGREDADIAQAVADILEADGIRVLLNTAPVSVSQSAAGAVELQVRSHSGDETLRGSHLLVATGRTPNSAALNLSAAGVTTDSRGFIQVDERLATNVPGIYAAGDIKGGPAFTHIAYDDFRILKANLLDGATATTSQRRVPYTVFIDPQLGRVGLTETEARAQGLDVRVAKLPMSSVARALEMDEPRGLMKAIVAADSDQILGCAILGIEGGELMSALQIAMLGSVPYTALRDGVFAHPTLSEAFNNLFGQLEASQ